MHYVCLGPYSLLSLVRSEVSKVTFVIIIKDEKTKAQRQ